MPIQLQRVKQLTNFILKFKYAYPLCFIRDEMKYGIILWHLNELWYNVLCLFFFRHSFSLTDNGKGLELQPGSNEFVLKTVAGVNVGCFFLNQLSIEVEIVK